MKPSINFIAILICGLLFVSCKKYLDKKASAAFAIPTTVQHLQALLDDVILNQRDPSSGEYSADDYYLTNNDWAGLSEKKRKAYTWEKDFPLSTGVFDE